MHSHTVTQPYDNVRSVPGNSEVSLQTSGKESLLWGTFLQFRAHVGPGASLGLVQACPLQKEGLWGKRRPQRSSQILPLTPCLAKGSVREAGPWPGLWLGMTLLAQASRTIPGMSSYLPTLPEAPREGTAGVQAEGPGGLLPVPGGRAGQQGSSAKGQHRCSCQGTTRCADRNTCSEVRWTRKGPAPSLTSVGTMPFVSCSLSKHFG